MTEAAARILEATRKHWKIEFAQTQHADQITNKQGAENVRNR